MPIASMPDRAIPHARDGGLDTPLRSLDEASASVLPIHAEGLVLSASGKRLVDIDALTLSGRGPTMVMGPNGAGKSLLLRLLHGLIDPEEGQVLYGGQPMCARIRRRQAMVFQRPVVLRRSVAANISFALQAHGVCRRERANRIRSLLEIGDLAGKARQPARTLSGGEQQRLALLRAISTEPDILFLDEPTSSLDPTATHRIEALILQAVERGVKVVMVTHDIGQARRLGAEIVFLHQGRVVEQASAAAFFKQPSTQPARAFLAGALLF
ncbi:ATP-binding cassette domain-containing protein [Aurantimonas sp. C2-6-R+9]|uniref:ATP-binding cassette domain-containing protein n=1 Tax=unclassified Aurantimonas TaxID=2638230 RepID=UPI002E18D879|nr:MULTISPECIES: ATP-binding cassette domain-containing protein [unclassified Aurantimonas]MEC5289465.1 ATP-binding cassette domain-containing protein [Aurantimonas sp. C2-3-R2]MEC5380822.1 ATP-binding cassette domain-containing protein [Aurantimonas sp. C2-6-R+9]MEC5410545.1 ATP-binding cassette domain-containing protein [Aurantimonas sp. C2-4-R8]